MTDITNVLNAWTLVEAITPFEIPDNYKIKADNFENNQPQMKNHWFTQSTVDVWNDTRFFLSKDEKEKQNQRRFEYYIEVFQKYQIEEKIREFLNVKEKLINLDKTEYYSLSFQVDDTGKVIQETIKVPLLMYALKYLSKNPSFDTSNIQQQFDIELSNFKDEIKMILAEEPLNSNLFNQIVNTYKKYFYSFDSKDSTKSPKNMFSILTMNENTKPTQAFNSFYIDDLSEAKKDPNKVLNAYITGQDSKNRLDIDENRDWIDAQLDPENLPDGRWPSKVEFRLSLMQQVAVNQIASEEQVIDSVNGPPGTGKTTLLKDIFAWLIVERAKEISNLKKPKDGFQWKKLHISDEYPTPILNSAIAQYKMVVASSNNGAVENISKELPLKEEIDRPNDNSESFDSKYSKAASDLKLFRNISETLVGDETWGLFSGVMGRTDNIKDYIKAVLDTGKKDKRAKIPIDEMKVNSLSQTLLYDPKFNFKEKWEAAKKQFDDELNTVRELKAELKEGYQLYQNNKVNKKQENDLLSEKSQKKIKINQLNQQRKHINENLDSLSNKIELEKLKEEEASIFQKIKNIIFGKDNGKIIQLKSKENELKNEQVVLKRNIKETNDIISGYDFKLAQIDEENQVFSRFKKSFEDKAIIPDDDYWADTQEAYAHRQEKTPWISDDLQFHRGRLFIYAMNLHQLFLIGNYTAVQTGLYNLKDRRKLIDSERRKIEEAWNTVHLITPVISTTFASLGRMYKGIGKDFIDYLFIDEAGQAVPQAAVGGMWRSRKGIAVGDPLQIEPVVTLEESLINRIRKNYNIDERLLSLSSSVQSITDEANKYGTYKDENKWIGMPLWVHRRCLNPMFKISNEIAYNNKMVLPSSVTADETTGQKGEVGWFDIIGESTKRQLVSEQAEKVAELIVEDWSEAKNYNKEPSVYVISPFTAVKDGIKTAVKKKLLREFPKEDFDWWLQKSIGTVHTFQGKEADKVYFVIGTDRNQNASVQWSSNKPNILNVAVTRAKKEFYIIGDYQRIKGMEYYDTFAKNSKLVTSD